MKFIIIKIFLSLFFILGSFVFVTAQTSENIEANVIYIKLKAEFEHNISNTSLKSINNRPLDVGIQSLNILNQQYNAIEMKRVFPYAGKYEEKHRQYGLHLWYEMHFLTSSKSSKVVHDYKMDTNIEIAEPIYKVRLFSESTLIPKDIKQSVTMNSTNDPLLLKQWHYNNTGQNKGQVGVDIRLFEAWDITMGDPRVIVSVVDGGIDYRHEDLAASMWVNTAELNGVAGIDDDNNGYVDDIYGYNFVTNQGDIIAHNHGTHVGGTIAAVNNNNKGVAGVAGGSGVGDGVRIMSCQIFETGKTGTNSTNPNAIVYGADNGAVISQNSWGYVEPNVYNAPVRDAIHYFIDNAGKDENNDPLPNTPMVGGIVIFAAGNDNSNALWYPGADDQVLSVAAINPIGKRSYYSNYATWVDISAPGGETTTSGWGVLSTAPNNQYEYLQGTSMACPHVSGVAALVLSKYGHAQFTPDSLRYRLLTNPIPLETWEPTYAPYMGVGLIDAKASLAPMILISSVNLPSHTTMDVGDKLQLTAEIIPANAFNKHITWSSDDTNIATVDNNGLVSGFSEGQTRIKVTTNEGQKDATCLVNVMAVPVTGFSVEPDSVMINLGKTRLIGTVFTPLNATNKDHTWTSTNPDVAEINQQGIVSSHNVGNTYIIGITEDGLFKDTCFLEVVYPVIGVAIEPSSLSMVVGAEYTLEAIILPDNAHNKNVTWVSSNPDIVSVSPNNGLLKAISGGKEGSPKISTISVSTQDGGKKADCIVYVYESVNAPKGFSPNSDGINDTFLLTLDANDTYALRIFDKSGQVYYESSDYKNDWDGVANTGFKKGAKVLPGTYFYVLTSKNGDSKKSYVVIRY